MATRTPRTRRRRYAPAEVDSALAVLAYYGGNSERAAVDTGVDAGTLRLWRSKQHRERYERIAEQRGPELEQLAVMHSREIMIRAGHAEHRIIDELDTDGLTPKERSELAGAFQRVATAKGINTDKMLTLTGRPREIVEHRDGTDILRRIGAKVPGLVVDASAVELPTAQGSNQPRDSSNERKLLAATHEPNTRVEPNPRADAGSNQAA